ncbi:hypothetical protein Tco_1154382 [Tanacetum coccineum]
MSNHEQLEEYFCLQLFKKQPFLVSFYREEPDDQWVRATDFTPSASIGQSSHLCLELSHDVDLNLGKQCGGRGGGVGSNSRVGEGKVEFIGGIGGGSFANRSMVAKEGLGGERSLSTSSRDGEDCGVENKSSMGSRLIATGEGGEEVLGLTKQHGLTLILAVRFRLVLFSLGIVKKGRTQEVGVKKKDKNGALFIEEDLS